MTATMYYIIFFFAGVGMSMLGLIWAMGPVARTWALAHVLKQKVVNIPTSDRTMLYKRVGRRNIDDKGNFWLRIGNKMKSFGIDPRWVYLAGKTPTTTLLETSDQNVDPTHAKLAMRKEQGEKNPRMKIAGENIDWQALVRQLKSRLGGDFIAGLYASAIAGNRDIDPLKNTKGMVIKWMVVIIVVFAIFAGLYVARMQGWF